LAVLLALLAYHLYGLSQSMQYIPMIWWLSLLLVAWCATREDVVMVRTPGEQSWNLRGARFVAVLVLVVNVSDFSLASIKSRYQLEHLDLDPQRHLYHGFYAREWWGQRQFRWSGRQAFVVVEGEGTLSFPIVSMNPHSGTRAVEVEVYLDGKLAKELSYSANWETDLRLQLKEQPQPHVIDIKVSHTWVPRGVDGGSDARRMGIAIGNMHLNGQAIGVSF
jgi:hypothetical protein